MSAITENSKALQEIHKLTKTSRPAYFSKLIMYWAVQLALWFAGILMIAIAIYLPTDLAGYSVEFEELIVGLKVQWKTFTDAINILKTFLTLLGFCFLVFGLVVGRSRAKTSKLWRVNQIVNQMNQSL